MSRHPQNGRTIDGDALGRAILVGTLCQGLTVSIGHFWRLLDDHAIGFLFAGMMISATVGYLYAQDVAKGYARGIYGGAIAGGACALIGVAVSVLLGDMTALLLLQRTLISMLTGAVGGFYGQLAADWT
jgi:hypothetical protein